MAPSGQAPGGRGQALRPSVDGPPRSLQRLWELLPLAGTYVPTRHSSSTAGQSQRRRLVPLRRNKRVQFTGSAPSLSGHPDSRRG